MGERKEFGFTLNRLMAIKPEAKRSFIYDTKTDGLRVQITPLGTTTFQFYKWVKDYGPVTICAALSHNCEALAGGKRPGTFFPGLMDLPFISAV